MIKYGWMGEIFDAKTAFLCGDLEKEIYLKIPTGLDLLLEKNMIQMIASFCSRPCTDQFKQHASSTRNLFV